MPKLLNREQALLGARALASVRVAIGVTAWLRPKLVLRPWVGGTAAEAPNVAVLGRALGARDIALGAGALLAARHGGPVRGWIEAGGLADTGDLIATLLTLHDLPRVTRWAIVATTLGAAAAAAVISPVVDFGADAA
jgi:hypothetical protein